MSEKRTPLLDKVNQAWETTPEEKRERMAYYERMAALGAYAGGLASPVLKALRLHLDRARFSAMNIESAAEGEDQ